jgi:hypothetical protein
MNLLSIRLLKYRSLWEINERAENYFTLKYLQKMTKL